MEYNYYYLRKVKSSKASAVSPDMIKGETELDLYDFCEDTLPFLRTNGCGGP